VSGVNWVVVTNNVVEVVSVGEVGPPGESVAVPVTFGATSAGMVPLTLKGAASQTGDLLDVKDNAGTVLASVGATGLITGTLAGLAYTGHARVGVSKQTLTGNLTLTNASPAYQFLDPGAAARTVSLWSSATTGDATLVKNTASLGGPALTVKDAGGASITTVYAGQATVFVWDGTNWQEC
jgi:hypothetical protein